ncbi:hypothetical protein HJA89_27795 [Rhizobium bangladeshense]|uniref:hypothetical protein n=1 Tax=Rhizobium TaxID=379 RepID=UPI001C829D57|nr:MULTISPECIES: hypothetical protein [Rhizobium]MBX4876644.1 hypothetical protein [Rhizobium bangladeshense]MBX4887576.1 hypothetical protein [Rhizobium bangladeshense]MBX5146367.1 hypothetical protein [Rhizobium lentis]
MVELVKILAQLLGAIVVARLTVTWAISRHKSEKTWERKEAAFTDILDSLLTMERAIDQQARLSRTFMDFVSNEQIKVLQAEYRAARQRYQQAIAIAQLLLPDEVSQSMIIAEGNLFELSTTRAVGGGQEIGHLREQLELLRRHRGEILAFGRMVLGDPNKNAPDVFGDPVGWFRYRNNLRKSFADRP